MSLADLLSEILRSNVTALNLRLRPLGDDGIATVAQALLDHPAHSINELTLERTNITDGACGTISALLLANPTIAVVSLADNRISEAGVLLLQPALRVSRRPPLGLTSLALSKNLLGDAGAVALAHALRDHRTLQGLNLSVNAIGDRGALALADTLAGIRCFRRLVLRSNDIGHEGACALFDALLRPETQCQLIDLEMNHLSDQSVIHLAPLLTKNSTLQQLNLRMNRQLEAESALALAHALRHNRALRTLNLHACPLRDASAAIFEALERDNWTLETLDLGSTGAGDAVASAFARALPHNSTLTTVYLHANNITRAGFDEVLAALQCNASISSLALWSYSLRTPELSVLLQSSVRIQRQPWSPETHKWFRPEFHEITKELWTCWQEGGTEALTPLPRELMYGLMDYLAMLKHAPAK